MIKKLLIFISIIISTFGKAQCPLVYDYLGNLSPKPYFTSCTGLFYNLNFQSNSSWGEYTINYGAGSPIVAGGAYAANTILTHNYAATVDTFVITLIISLFNCKLIDVVVMEKPVNASIQIPIGDVTQACAPKTLSFTNSSTDVSPANDFIWKFGDYWNFNHDSIFNWKPWPPKTPISIAYPAVGTYSFIVRDSNLCGVDTAIIIVQIFNPLTASLAALPGPLCQITPITFSNASPPGFTYLWDFGTGGGFVNLGTGGVFLENFGNVN